MQLPMPTFVPVGSRAVTTDVSVPAGTPDVPVPSVTAVAMRTTAVLTDAGERHGTESDRAKNQADQVDVHSNRKA
jgi:hypothetical protein